MLLGLDYESRNRFYKVIYIFGGDRMKVWENYKWSIILLISVIIGGIVGL
ncbi:proton/sodium-glutamate symporter, partial [Clostridium botulinum A1 str. CFSAN002368]